jgi:uncharacterized membrane protein (UPF0182 family)
MSTRRLAIGVVAIAAILLGGRALSVLYDSFTWYDSLGAAALWTERAVDTGLVYGIGFVVATAFALLNFIAVGGAVGALVRPRRLANVEFGEAVPPSQLRLAAVAASVTVGIVLTRLLPSWSTVALARLGVDFREADPYLHHDLSFYVSWLPLERALYSWAFALLVSVSAIVLATYVFASGIRWNGGVLQMTARVRRHLGVLAALLLLLFTWSYRLDSYELLSGVGRDGALFGYFEHQWMLPGLLGLALATAATGITIAISAWMGQLRTSLIAIMFAIGLAAIVHEVIPFVFFRATSESEETADNAPYLATRADFTRRAFGTEIEGTDTENSPFAGLSSVSAASAKTRDSLVAPGASGMELVDDPTLDVAGPSLGTGLARLAHAWAARRFGLLADSIHRRARIVTVRDVRERVARLYPLFYVGQALRPLFRADTLYWSVALYSSSAAYPLAERREISGETRSYFHRAGTAFVSGRTGRVFAALDVPPEPVATGWIRKFESSGSLTAAQVLQRSLSVGTSANAVTGGGADTTFGTNVIRLYDRMRSALSAGDLRGFGLAYDSLGALVGRTRK